MSDTPPDENSESETFRYTPRDKAALVALMRIHFPRLKNRSEVLRAVFRLGVPLLAENPSLLHTAETPTPESLTAEAIRARQQAATDAAKADASADTAHFIKTGKRKGPPSKG